MKRGPPRKREVDAFIQSFRAVRLARLVASVSWRNDPKRTTQEASIKNGKTMTIKSEQRNDGNKQEQQKHERTNKPSSKERKEQNRGRKGEGRKEERKKG